MVTGPAQSSRACGLQWLFAIALAGSLGISALAESAELDPMFRIQSLFSEVDIGVGSWISQGRTTTSHNASGLTALLGNPTSELDFKKIPSNIVEGHVGLVHSSGVLFRGRVGYGGITGGNLIDDDYVTAAGATAFGTSVSGAHRFSRTESPIDGDSLWYLNADLGYRLLAFQERRGHLDAFVGYQVWRERVVAKGVRQLECTAVGTICSAPGAAFLAGVPAITNTTLWQSLRVGAEVQVELTRGLTLKVEGVVMPYSSLRNEDIHHLRGDLQQTPSFALKGTGWGYNVDGEVGFRVLPNLTATVGYRVWWVRVKDAEWTNYPVGSPSETAPAQLRSLRHGATFGLNFDF